MITITGKTLDKSIIQVGSNNVQAYGNLPALDYTINLSGPRSSWEKIPFETFYMEQQR